MRDEVPYVFDVIHNSFVDGPGIRTVVFFKGCNLRCGWCHNPESQHPEREILFDRSRCIGCGKCLSVCPNHGKSCTFCGLCALYCPKDARSLCGKAYTSEELLAIILKDQCFYRHDDGGVTVSGGECLLYPDFVLEILRSCHTSGIHTAVDTAGCVPWSTFETILSVTDLFLFDIKAVTHALHQKGTGSDNRLILENYRRLIERGIPVWVRIPLIGGFNDTREELKEIESFLSRFRPQRVDVLPYHRMGEGKYAALERETPCYTVPDAETTETWRLHLSQVAGPLA